MRVELGWMKAAVLAVLAATPSVGMTEKVEKLAVPTDAEAAIQRGHDAWRKDDFATARKEYQTACDAKDMEGCFQAGLLFDNDHGGMMDRKEANRLYGIACDGGNIYACNNLGYNYLEGAGTEKDLAKARFLFEKSCDGNDALACINLGDLIIPEEAENLASDHARYKQAYAYYVKGCGLDDGKACTRMGYALDTGQGVKQDDKAAFAAYSKSCANDFAVGCYNVGVFYRDGRGARKSMADAMRYYDMACTKGDSDGCATMGAAYMEGSTVTKDVLKGASYLDKACTLEDTDSCNELADYYMDGETLPVDYAAADRLYAKSCELDDATGCAMRAFPMMIMNEEKLMDGTAIAEARKWVARSNELEKDNEAAKLVNEAIVEVEKLAKEGQEQKSLTNKIFGK